MTRITAIGRVAAKPGKRDEMLAAFAPLVELAQDEEGVPIYVIHTDRGDDETIWFYEVFEDQASLDVHAAASKALVTRVIDEFAASPPVVIFASPEIHTGFEPN